MELNPYQPTDRSDLDGVQASQPIPLLRAIGFAALSAIGFVFAAEILLLGQPVVRFCIAGLPCERGWKEAVHALSFIAALYPLIFSVCLAFGIFRVPRWWANGLAAIAFGLAAWLIWSTSQGRFPSGIESISSAPAGRYVSATLHGLSHVLLIPIGVYAGECLRRRKLPRLRVIDCAVLGAISAIWIFAVFETKTSFQHALLRWLTFLTLLIFAARIVWKKNEHSGEESTATQRSHHSVEMAEPNTLPDSS